MYQIRQGLICCVMVVVLVVLVVAVVVVVGSNRKIRGESGFDLSRASYCFYPALLQEHLLSHSPPVDLADLLLAYHPTILK